MDAHGGCLEYYGGCLEFVWLEFYLDLCSSHAVDKFGRPYLESALLFYRCRVPTAARPSCCFELAPYGESDLVRSPHCSWCTRWRTIPSSSEPLSLRRRQRSWKLVGSDSVSDSVLMSVLTVSSSSPVAVEIATRAKVPTTRAGGCFGERSSGGSVTLSLRRKQRQGQSRKQRQGHLGAG